MAQREGFFETVASPTISQQPVTGELDAMAIGDLTISGTGTNFDPQFTAGDLITFLDTAGERQFYTIKTIDSDILMTLNQPIRTVAPASNFDFTASVIQSPSFVVRDAVNKTFPLGDPLFGFAASNFDGYRLGSPDSAGLNPRDAINNNEGITIKTIYVRNPYQHTWADKGMMLIFRQIVEGGTGTTDIIQELGINGEVYLPSENTEIPVDIYIPPYDVAISEGQRWGLMVNVENSLLTQDQVPTDQADSVLARMSNVSVPSEMDGLILPMVIGIRFTYGFTIFSQ